VSVPVLIALDLASLNSKAMFVEPKSVNRQTRKKATRYNTDTICRMSVYEYRTRSIVMKTKPLLINIYKSVQNR